MALFETRALVASFLYQGLGRRIRRLRAAQHSAIDCLCGEGKVSR
ncbi:hypothetical protein [Thermodesulfitimonas autotrophica]